MTQDYSCLVLADGKGMRIYSVDSKQMCYQIEVGAVRAAEMLFSTSLLAFVGAGASLSCSQYPPNSTSSREGLLRSCARLQ